MDRASIIAIEEVCKRCHLYTKHCGMLECPSQCVDSGHFIDGYHKAEKDLALMGDDIKFIIDKYSELPIQYGPRLFEEILKQFNEQREKK